MRRTPPNARTLAGVLVFALMALLAGCAAPPQTRALLDAPTATGLPMTAELADVPYYAQEVHQCGPATLAMALNAAGAQTTPEQLVPQVYLPGREGSLQVEMLAATRRQGLLAYTLSPQLNDVLAEIAHGRPVVVLQNLAFNWYPRWHYAVAIGYDLSARTITLRSGPDSRQLLPLSTFEYTWARSDRWAIMALPPDYIPVTATPENFLNAALALETTGQPAAARQAYRAAAARWPQQFGALIGLGNTSYAARDYIEAEQAFRRATRLRSDDAVAHNNLADTLMQRGELDAALRFAETAVWLGGDKQPTYRQTLDEIKARIAQRPKPAPAARLAPPPKKTMAPARASKKPAAPAKSKRPVEKRKKPAAKTKKPTQTTST
jgi:tetratricopeptide (TPR) repeat protein